MNDAAKFMQVDVSMTLPSLHALMSSLQQAAAAADPANENSLHARAALRLVEDAAMLMPCGRTAVMTPMRLAAQHLRAVQTASSDDERGAFGNARRSMSASLFEAADLPA